MYIKSSYRLRCCVVWRLTFIFFLFVFRFLFFLNAWNCSHSAHGFSYVTIAIILTTMVTFICFGCVGLLSLSLFFSPFILFVLIHRYTVVQRRIIDLEYLMSLLYESGNICWSLDSFIRSELNRSHNNLCSILHPLNQFDSDFSISLARLI